MHIPIMVLALLSCISGVGAVSVNPCGEGNKIASSCLGIEKEGCCVDGGKVRWCASGVLCELSCGEGVSCGWDAKAAGYKCGVEPKADPSCVKPYSCFQDGCAASTLNKGCCGCACEESVCATMPECCTVAWSAECVAKCKETGGCGSSDGCIVSKTGGCQDCSCQPCVCNIDPFCCSDRWDLLCAQYCVGKCNGSCQLCVPSCLNKQCGSDGCGGSCGTCPAGYDCKENKCLKKCVPNCTGRECGADGCGGACGTCTINQLCNAYGKCVDKPCEPVCSGKECGPNGCGGSCGICSYDEKCNAAGTCEKLSCVPECKGRLCGGDKCGGFCGFCDPGKVCVEETGRCKPYCPPDCTGKVCGGDGCGGTCGTCDPGLDCFNGECIAICWPKCEGRQCGTDWCEGTCGTCGANSPYCVNGQCKPQCTKNCAGKQCGDDGCGGSCGTCPAGWFCNALGSCSPFCQPQCFVPPDFMSEKACGWNGCPGNGICGVCQEGFECTEDYKCVEKRCSCENKQCGLPAEGCESCGTCPAGDICDLETVKDPDVNVCEPCVPSCALPDNKFKECGEDGCGGQCGFCPPGWQCDTDNTDGDEFYFKCEVCTPNCGGKDCGADGCGGFCGFCTVPGDVCDETDGKCKQCTQQCLVPPLNIETMACGPSSCPPGCMDAGTIPCQKESDCPLGLLCNAYNHTCVACTACGNCPKGYVCDVSTEDDPEIYTCDKCNASCLGKECGADGCGGVCGTCDVGETCNAEFKCEKPCYKKCLNRECGPDSCPEDCMTQGTEACDKNGKCPGTLICDPKQNKCVPCSGTCGTCDAGEICSKDYICVPGGSVDPCEGRECGSDGEGGTCGSCSNGEVCNASGTCVEDSDAQGDTGGKDLYHPPDLGGPETIECPPGYYNYYGKCIKEEVDAGGGGGGGGGGSCSMTRTGAIPAALSALALFLLFGLVRARRRQS